MKKVMVFLMATILSIIMGLVVPNLLNDKTNIENIDSGSILPQKIKGYSNTNAINYKLYDNGKLVGVVSNKDLLYQKIKDYHFDTEIPYDSNLIGLTENIYIVDELSRVIYEDIDSSILRYLYDNECIGIETTCVEFSTDEGVFDKIYIASEEDFKNARDQFISNFVSQDTINKINNKEKIDSPVSPGSVEMNVTIKQKMEFTKGVSALDNILKNEKEIYEYLCYGRNTERQYYTTKEGDTLAGVGRFFNNMSAKQVMMINPDIIKDEDPILEVGTVLNVTYYNSPLTITVTKERLAQEVIYPEDVYTGGFIVEEDPSLLVGQTRVEVEQTNGFKNVLYSETWVNGVLKKGEEKSFMITKNPTQGKMLVGTGTVVSEFRAGSGNWHWPVANPTITCDYYCYAGHGGVDFYNLYNPWDYVLAIDSGTVTSTGWTDLGGYYARIDHNNGYSTYYGHFSSMPYVEAGQSVSAGEILGPIGMTGNATGPHVHLAMYENGTMINPCSVLDCSLLY